MNNKILYLIKKLIDNDELYLINNLIDDEIIALDQVVNTVIESKKKTLILKISKDIRNLSEEMIDNLADSIIEQKDGEYIYKFATEVKNAPVNKLINALISLKDSKHIYLYVKSNVVDDKLLTRMVNSLIEANNIKYTYELLEYLNFNIFYKKEICDDKIKELSNVILNSNNGEYILSLYELDLDFLSDNDFIETVLKIQDINYICKLTNEILLKNGNVTPIVDYIISSNDSAWIYTFAKDVGICREKLVDAIIKLNEAEYIYAFAYSFKWAPLDILSDAIIKTKHTTHILNFLMFVENAPVDKLSKYILENGNSNEIERVNDFLNFRNGKIVIKLDDYLTPKKHNFEEQTDEETIELLIKLTSKYNYEELEENKEKFKEFFKEDNKVKKLEKK